MVTLNKSKVKLDAQGGTPESDAIAAINKRKIGAMGAIAGNDAVTSEPESQPGILGNDSADEPASAPVAETPADSTPATATLTAEELQALLRDAVAPLQENVNQLQSDLATTRSQLEEAQQQLTTTQQDRDRLAGVFRVMGSQHPGNSDKTGFPMVNTIASTRSDKAQGAAAEFLNTYDKAPRYEHQDSDGMIRMIRDSRELTRFVRENRDSIRKDMEVYAKNNGLLRGGNKAVGSDAATVRADVPDGFLAYLSSVTRLTHIPSFIFHQFVNVKFDFAKGQGDTIKMPRFAYNSTPTATNDRLLSGSGTYAAIASGNQNLTQGAVSCTVQEWGLGLNNSNAPIAIPQFVSAYSLLDLEQILERNLGYDHHFWQDMTIRGLWHPTSRIVYNNGGNVTTATADLAAGDDGTLTEDFLDDLYSYMRGLQIPTYADGCYGLATHSKGRSQLRKSIADRFRFPTEAAITDVLNILNSATGGERDRVSGYLGKISNFHVFETNAYGMGAAGTEGVQNETIAGSARLTRTSFAFGADSIGYGVGTEMEIRRDEKTDFGRIDRYIWREESGFVAIDVDPTGYSDSSAVPQQLRVLELRNLDQPL
ncbi:MAG: hypothetical protein EBS38_08000 [Actinobacteria bacterium]|nr:hypothetical protein [Actinomycetota bacterium]